MSLLDKVKQRREEFQTKKASQTRTYKFKPGKTVISILPLHGVKDDFTKQYGMHYIKNRAGDFVAAIGDRQITYGEECPVREALMELRRYASNVGDDELANQTNQSLAKPSNLVNVNVHRDPDGKAEDVPQLCAFSDSLMEQIYSILEEYLADDPSKLLRFDDRLALVIEREGTGLKDTRYKVYPAAKAVSVSPDILSKAVNIDEYIAGQFLDGAQKALAYVASVTGKASIAHNTSMAKALTGPTPSAAKSNDEAIDVDFEDYAAPMAKPEAIKRATKQLPPEEDDDNLDDILASLEN